MLCFYFFGALTVVVALYFYPFGGIKRLKGIKNLSEEERNNIQLNALSLNVAAVFAFLAAIFIFAANSAFFRDNIFKWLLAAWFVFSISDKIFISRSQFYFKNKRKGGVKDEKERTKQSSH